jgi:hypothetical protein
MQIIYIGSKLNLIFKFLFFIILITLLFVLHYMRLKVPLRVSVRVNSDALELIHFFSLYVSIILEHFIKMFLQ